MRITIAAGALALALSGCSATQFAKFQGYVTVACEKDGQYQPIALAVLQTVGPAFAPAAQAAALDATLVHPIVVDLCAKLGAIPALMPAKS